MTCYFSTDFSLVVSQDNQQDAAKREKTRRSCSVASRQLAIVERVLLHALASGHPGAAHAIVSCFWASPSGPSGALPSSEEEDEAQMDPARSLARTGIMTGVDQLATNGKLRILLL